MQLINRSLLYFLSYTEKHDHLSSSDPSSFVEWKITDVADYSKLGRKDRLQYKKDLLGEYEC